LNPYALTYRPDRHSQSAGGGIDQVVVRAVRKCDGLPDQRFAMRTGQNPDFPLFTSRGERRGARRFIP
jgi:hypothetical protein